VEHPSDEFPEMGAVLAAVVFVVFLLSLYNC